jgi:hypothetical protein
MTGSNLQFLLLTIKEIFLKQIALRHFKFFLNEQNECCFIGLALIVVYNNKLYKHLLQNRNDKKFKDVFDDVFEDLATQIPLTLRTDMNSDAPYEYEHHK